MLTNFDKIYPFTTEDNKSYIKEMNVLNKSILTLGSSCDQALNSLLLGAKDVTIFDINSQVKEFYEFKKSLILKYDRYELISKILESNLFSFYESFSLKDLCLMNLYLENDNNYLKLRQILKDKSPEFITGDIFKIKDILKNKYDRVILSNVLQYLKGNNCISSTYNLFSSLKPYLNSNFIIQLYYFYANIPTIDLYQVMNYFYQKNEDIVFEKITTDFNDSVVLVKSLTNKNIKY